MDESGNSAAAERRLPGPELPADHGLSGLGLLMQLAGSLFVGVMAYLATVMFALRGPGTGEKLLVLAAVLGIARSWLHRSAGTALLRAPSEEGGRPMGRVTLYAIAAIAHSLLVVVLLGTQADVEGPVLVTTGLTLVSWPLTLLVVTRLPRFRRFSAGLPMPEDRGFEGGGVLMLLLGITGALIAALMLISFVQSGYALKDFTGLTLLVVLALLLIRSAVHTSVGARAVRGASPAEVSRASIAYVNWGIASSVVAGLVFLAIMARAHAPGAALGTLIIAVYLLSIWPVIVRRFVLLREPPLALDADEPPAWSRAPDLGLTALGWLLLATAVLGLSQAVPLAVVDTGARLGGMAGAADLMAPADLARAAGRSPWLPVVILALQMWAALELLTMSRRARLAAAAYGMGGAALALYAAWPLFEQIGGPADASSGVVSSLTAIAAVALSLVLPIGTVALAARSHQVGPAVRMGRG